MKLAIASAALCVAVVAAPACGGALLTEQEIAQNGTHVFDKPIDKVFVAAVQALKGEDYEIAIELPDRGLIKTGRKRLGAQATGNAHSANVTTFSRQ